MLILVIAIALFFGALLGVGFFFLYRYFRLKKMKDLVIMLSSLTVLIIANVVVSFLLPGKV